MPGGLLQLAAIGSQDQLLISNPQITFFKIVYRRYTNFASEFKTLNFTGNTQISFNSENSLVCKIDRHADLLGEIYFCFDIPDIYSDGISRKDIMKTQNSNDGNNIPDNFDVTKVYNFYWVKNLGTTIIKSIFISIGGQIIDKHYGEWLQIWNELNMNFEKKKKYNELIGNIPEIYEPDLSLGNQKWYSLSQNNNDSIYSNPTTPINDEIPFSVPNYPGSDPKKFNFNKPQYPSIKGRRIRVPLQFWFCQNPGLALPLISLQYHDIHIHIELRPVKELYTILHWMKCDKNPEFSTDIMVGPNNLNWVRTSPDPGKLSHYIGNFLPNLPNPATITGTDTTSPNSDTSISYINRLWNLNPNIEANFYFLDSSERKKFALQSQEYLITQIQHKQINGIVGRNLLNIDFQNPVKELIWVAKRDDIQNRNDWNNYTNWFYPNIPIVCNNNVNPYYFGNIWDDTDGIINHPFNYYNLQDKDDYTPGQTGPYPFASNENDKNFQKNILENAILYINNSERFPEKKGDFFNNLQPYQYHDGSSGDGINVFSFALEPGKYQPSGACNFSRINKAGLYVNLLPPPMLKSSEGQIMYAYSFDINIYATNHNILRIMGGMAGLGFIN